MANDRQKNLDEALDMTFPASDPLAIGQSTGTEAPKRPADRAAPVIDRSDVEAAAARRKGRKPRRPHAGGQGGRAGEDAPSGDAKRRDHQAKR
jgi:hypothetical protein